MLPLTDSGEAGRREERAQSLCFEETAIANTTVYEHQPENGLLNNENDRMPDINCTFMHRVSPQDTDETRIQKRLQRPRQQITKWRERRWPQAVINSTAFFLVDSHISHGFLPWSNRRLFHTCKHVKPHTKTKL